MHPGTTYSPPVRFAPRRFPGGSRECRLAVPCEACEAYRTCEKGRSVREIEGVVFGTVIEAERPRWKSDCD